MSEFARGPEYEPAEIEVGEKLPGLLATNEELQGLPEGVKYGDQVVPSPYGPLYYAPDQRRGGSLKWVTDHGEVSIKVEAGSGTVVEIDEDAREKHSFIHDDAYEMGIKEYREVERRIAAGEDPTNPA